MIKKILEFIKSERPRIAHNQSLIKIVEGDLMTYVREQMQKELRPAAFERAIGRVPPINVFQKMVDKLTRIYAEGVKRETENPTDQELIAYYEDEAAVTEQMGFANRLFNSNGYSAIEPYVDNGVPRLRVIPADRFLVYSDNEINPLEPTIFIKLMGKDESGQKEIYYLYTATEFLAIDDSGSIRYDLMGDSEGINPYGRLPFVYVSSSKIDLLPTLDTDNFAMSKLPAILLGDLNYATQYQSHSILYGIDIDSAEFDGNPDSVWILNSTDKENASPSIGSITPTVAIDEVIKSIKEQVALWFETKGLKATANGSLDVGNAASGIAKMIDESDTTVALKKQVRIFQNAEADLWSLIAHMHSIWAKAGIIDERRAFSKDFDVLVEFAEIKPVVDMKLEIEKAEKLMALGILTRERAAKMIYPDLTDEEIAAMLEEVAAEKEENMALFNANMQEPNEDNQDEQEDVEN